MYPSRYENNEETGWQREMARDELLPRRNVGLEDSGKVIHKRLHMNSDIRHQAQEVQ